MTSILASEVLTTYAEAKARLNAIGTAIVDGTDQAAVERLVNAVSDAVVGYCGRGFALVSRTERYQPPRGELLQLAARPISSVTSVSLDGTAVTDYEVADADQGLLYRAGGWSGELYEDACYGSVTGATVPGSARPVLSVVYSGGYVTPSQAAASPTGGATLSARTGSGAGSVTGTAGSSATGTLETYAFADGDTYEMGVRWNGGSYAFVASAEVGDSIDLVSVDASLSGLTWTFTTAALVSPLAESWAIVPSVAAPTRTLPWDLEEAVLVAVAVLWRQRSGGWASDVMPEQNTAIGRGAGGLLPDSVLPVLARYRRGDG